MRALALNELMAGRHGHYGLLTLGSRTASPRHQTLRATVDWSYGLCTPREQILWARLSTFSGNFDITDAEDVCADDAVTGEDFFAAITGLVDKSILILDEQNGPARYRLLETIREYGRERLLDRGEEREFLARHRDHYLGLAERVRREWFGPGQLELFAKLRAVQANIRAVLEYCLATSAKRDTGLRVAASLWPFWLASGQQREGWHWLTRLLASAGERGGARAEALWSASYFAILAGDNATATTMLDECRELAEQFGDKELLAHVAYASGLVAFSVSDPDRWRVQVTTAVRFERDVEPPNPYLPLALIDVGLALCISGEVVRGEELFKECVAICEAHQDRWVRSWGLLFLGLSALLSGDNRRASDVQRAGLREKREFGDLMGIGLALEFLAWTAAADGAAKRAAHLFGACRALWEPMGSYLIGSEALLRWHADNIKLVRDRLGESTFDAAFQAGAGWDREDAVSFALDEKRPERPDEEHGGRPVLTKREIQVADRVSEGMSDREVAEALVIAIRTVDTHVEHILTKWLHVACASHRMEDRATPVASR